MFVSTCVFMRWGLCLFSLGYLSVCHLSTLFWLTFFICLHVFSFHWSLLFVCLHTYRCDGVSIFCPQDTFLVCLIVLFVHPFSCLSSLSVGTSAYLPDCLLIVCLAIFLSCLTTQLSVCKICLPASVFLYVCLPVCISIYLYVSLFVSFLCLCLPSLAVTVFVCLV